MFYFNKILKSETLKRIFDIFVSLTALILLSPILLVISLILYLSQGKPILFKQERTGRGGCPFFIYKFRTMKNAYDKEGNPLPDNQRITAVGNFLRKTSLDELPELFNVLLGDMSIVGPRPLMHQYISFYSKEEARRHSVRPGITGWAQVNGRNALTWQDKFKLDLWYVDNWNLLLDIKIIFLTIYAVLFAKGVNASESETMPLFTGSNNHAKKDSNNDDKGKKVIHS